MRTKQHARLVGLFAICALMALPLACTKEKAQPSGDQKQPQPTTTPTPAAKTPTPAVKTPAPPAPTKTPAKAARVPKPPLTGKKRTVTLPDPQTVTIPDVAVVVRFNRFDQTLPKVANLISAFVPNFTVETIKAQIGLMLQDPALAGLDQTRSIVLCGFAPAGSPKPAFAALLPVNGERYKAQFEAMGSFVHQKAGGKTLLVSRDEVAAVAGQKAFTSLEALMNRPATNDLSVYVNIEMLMSRYSEAVNAAIAQMMTMMQTNMQAMGEQVPGGAMGVSMFGMEAYGALEAAKDLKDLDVSVSISRNSVDVSSLLRAKPGSGLAGALVEPIVPDTSVLAYVPGAGAIHGYVGGDSEPGRVYFENLLDRAIAAAPTAPGSKFDPGTFKDAIVANIGRWDFVAFDFLTPGAGGQLNGTIVYVTRDPEGFLDTVRSAKDLMEKSGMTDVMPMEIDFQENARTYKGVSIHKYTQKMDVPIAPAPGMEVFQQFMQSVTNQQLEIAIVDNYAISAMGSARIEPIIDAVKAKKPISKGTLNAQSLLQEGSIYLDVHPGRVVAVIFEFLQAAFPQGAQAAPKLARLPVKPISAALAAERGKLQVRMVAPIDSIIQTKDAATQALGGQVAPVAP